jgi:hypothetical protein
MLLYRYITLLCIACLGFALSSCGSSTTVGGPFIGGTTGLDFTFVDGAPPSEVGDGASDSFSVIVSVKNQGEADLDASGGYIQLNGILPVDYGKSSGDFKQTLPALRGSAKTAEGDLIPGEEQVISFDGLSYQKNILGNIEGTKIVVEACYNYQTRSTTLLCVKKEGIDFSDKDEVCKINDPKTVYNSAGPVQVVRAKQIPLRDKIQVQFEIAKVGSLAEYIVKPDTDCNDKSTNPDKNYVYVEVKPIMSGTSAPSCNFAGATGGSSGFVRIPDSDGATALVSCSFDKSAVVGDATTSLDLTLKYRYFMSKSIALLIKDRVENTQ